MTTQDDDGGFEGRGPGDQDHVPDAGAHDHVESSGPASGQGAGKGCRTAQLDSYVPPQQRMEARLDDARQRLGWLRPILANLQRAHAAGDVAASSRLARQAQGVLNDLEFRLPDASALAWKLRGGPQTLLAIERIRAEARRVRAEVEPLALPFSNDVDCLNLDLSGGGDLSSAGSAPATSAGSIDPVTSPAAGGTGEAGPGQAIPSSLQGALEGATGARLGAVRLHAGPQANALAASHDARAVPREDCRNARLLQELPHVDVGLRVVGLRD